MVLQFSHKEEVPGSKVRLNLKAAPGSLCSVRAVDKSILLKQNQTLTADRVSVACCIQPPNVCLPSASMHGWEEAHSTSQDSCCVRWLPCHSPSSASSQQLRGDHVPHHRLCAVSLCLRGGGCYMALQGQAGRAASRRCWCFLLGGRVLSSLPHIHISALLSSTNQRG